MSRLIRPTSRVLILAVELALSGVALLLVSDAALADSTIQVTNTATQDISGGTSVVESGSTSQVQSVGGQLVTSDSSNPPSNTSSGVVSNTVGANGQQVTSLTGSVVGTSDATLPASSTAPTSGTTGSTASPATNATPANPIVAAMAKIEADSVIVGTLASAGSAGHSGYVHYATITRHSAAPELATDTASTVPDPVKSPIKSTGLFGQLADHLATIVVPGHTRLNATMPIHLATLVSIILSTLLLTDLIIRSFGQTMRRSGFIHAARSDLPASSFAPPHLLGYVPAYGRAT